MQCDICKRSQSRRLPFNCTKCARNALYQPRLQHAQVLLQKETAEKQIEETVNGKAGSSKTSRSRTTKQERSATWALRTAQRDRAASEDKIRAIQPHVETLRQEVEAMKVDIASRKARILQRRAELDSAKSKLALRQAKALDPLKKGIGRINAEWDLLHEKIAESRLFLNRESAHLFGLEHHRRKRGSKSRDVYTIGGVPTVDLRDLNNSSPSVITTSNTQLAYLVHLVSHYLSLRLPAEITLPHRDYPFPTIFSPTYSYTTNRSVPFPGTTPSHSSSNSPSTSRHAHNSPSDDQLRPLPRPRILHLDKSLSTLAKEDQVTYGSFIEGVTFLAWDIMWLCRTQGIPVAKDSWEDICAMGKNLYRVTVLNASAAVIPTSIDHHVPTNIALAKPLPVPVSSKDKDRPQPANVPPPPHPTPPPPPAHFSHNTTYAFLGTAQGIEYMTKGWRLNSHVKAVDKVKAMLLAERTGEGWEFLEGEEWAAEGGGGSDEKGGDGKPKAAPVVVGETPGKKAAAAAVLPLPARTTMPLTVDAAATGRREDVPGKLKLGGKGVEETGVLVPPVHSHQGNASSTSTRKNDESGTPSGAIAAAGGGGGGGGGGAGGGGRERGWMKVKSRSSAADT